LNSTDEKRKPLPKADKSNANKADVKVSVTQSEQRKPNKRKFPEDDASKATHKKSKKMKLKHENINKNQSTLNDISENRLKAFGINPKKFNNKLKYQTSKTFTKKN